MTNPIEFERLNQKQLTPQQQQFRKDLIDQMILFARVTKRQPQQEPQQSTKVQEGGE